MYTGLNFAESALPAKYLGNIAGHSGGQCGRGCLGQIAAEREEALRPRLKEV